MMSTQSFQDNGIENGCIVLLKFITCAYIINYAGEIIEGFITKA